MAIKSTNQSINYIVTYVGPLSPLIAHNQLISYALPNTLPRIIFRLWQLSLLSNLKNPFFSNRSLKNQPKALLKRSSSPSKYLPTSTQKSLTPHSLLPLAKRVLSLPKYLSNAPFSPQPSQAKLCYPLFFRKPLLSAKATSRELFSFLFSFSPPFLFAFFLDLSFQRSLPQPPFPLPRSFCSHLFYCTPSTATFFAPLLLQPPFLLHSFCSHLFCLRDLPSESSSMCQSPTVASKSEVDSLWPLRM